jgi:hypothetical protein
MTPEQRVEDAARALLAYNDEVDEEMTPKQVSIALARAALATAEARIAELEAEVARKDAALRFAALGFYKHNRLWRASAERTDLIEDRLRADNALALSDAARAALTACSGQPETTSGCE